MLEPYYNFFDTFCDVNNFEQMKLDKDSVYIALAEKCCLIAFVRRKKMTRKSWEKTIAEIHLQQIQKQVFSSIKL